MKDDPLSGLLAALLGGHPAVQDHMQNTGRSLDHVVGRVARAKTTTADGGAAGSSLMDILASLMGGSPQAGSGQTTGGDPLSAILGELLGGGVQPGSAAQQSAGGDLLSSILGGLLGGGIQGGKPSTGAVGNNAFLGPIVDAIAAKVGLPRQMAQGVVSFALSQVMGGQRDPQLARMLGGKGTVSQTYLRDSGLAKQLARETGMDHKTAGKSLQQVLEAFATQMGEGSMHDRQQGLQSWLEPKSRPVGGVARHTKPRR